VETSVCVDVVWRNGGVVTLDSSGKLVFPKPPALPGIYRMALIKRDGFGVTYVGQSDSLPRRFGNYRNPGPTQQTSKRINGLLLKVLSDGGRIEVELAVEGRLSLGGEPAVLDLKVKAHRLLAEGAAVVSASGDGREMANL
jgi:hypothetical protein